ncbi:PepSY-associated TM helix domain-containing protein [Xanthovirga aplysinae]|uniref:PepSY-associated TM helix domain-containing protein n=1 Tax=Xanthovirga aplysinae TaxID=2529853 RepID=UPI0012BCF50C|nr:PepSY-associated TM helix domain-containing protein [Xanthovirga aplysinae]MTI31208.1 PepSY domain-containing protein [Xanthovirga aplysinae]
MNKQIPKKKKFKKTIRKIHLYLGLITGLISLNTCITGCLMVFEDELSLMLYPHRFQLNPEKEALPIQSFVAQIEGNDAILENGFVYGARVFSDPSQAYQIFVRNPEKESRTVFVDPYQGKLLEVYNGRNSFFHTIEMLHRNLLLGKVGKNIVGYSTIGFVFLLISGLILWFPKRNKAWKKRFSIKWQNTSWKRRNYDLHSVLGFYSLIFLFLICSTGLVWSFKIIRNAIVAIEKPTEEAKPKSNFLPYDVTQKIISLDQAYETAKQHFPNAKRTTIRFSDAPDGVASASITTLTAPHENGYHTMVLDKYSGKLLRLQLFEELPLGQKIYRYIYPIHIGSIYGLPTKILAFIVCLIGFSLPISGLWIWIFRKNKKRKKLTKSSTSKTQNILVKT